MAYCAVGMRYCAGVSDRTVPPIVNENVPVGLVVNLASPVVESVLPPDALRNLVYAEEGM